VSARCCRDRQSPAKPCPAGLPARASPLFRVTSATFWPLSFSRTVPEMARLALSLSLSRCHFDSSEKGIPICRCRVATSRCRVATSRRSVPTCSSGSPTRGVVIPTRVLGFPTSECALPTRSFAIPTCPFDPPTGPVDVPTRAAGSPTCWLAEPRASWTPSTDPSHPVVTQPLDLIRPAIAPAHAWRAPMASMSEGAYTASMNLQLARPPRAD
jgi:hypothetical protein